MKTYKLYKSLDGRLNLVDELNLADCIKCLKCKRVSYNINDVVQRYCGCCRMFHNEMFIKSNKKV